MAGSGSGGGCWTQDRLNMIGMTLDRPWINPGQAAIALDLHRSSVHNYMSDGRLTWARLKGSRLRSVRSIDVLRLVLVEMEQAGDGCPPELIEHVRCAVEHARRAGCRTANGERRTANGIPNDEQPDERPAEWRTADDATNGEQLAERSTERRTANGIPNDPMVGEPLANGEQFDDTEHQANGEQ